VSLIFGIDPGTYTGVALWDAAAQRFKEVHALPVHRALEKVRAVLLADRAVPVIFEDARQRQWFGHTGREVLQGAGAAKRDAVIWQDFLEDIGAPYIARKPGAGSTKWKADQFARLTQWSERTNEHGRDAGVLVFGLTVADVANVVRSWDQMRANSTAHTSARR
jgi:hypothetical protein